MFRVSVRRQGWWCAKFWASKKFSLPRNRREQLQNTLFSAGKSFIIVFTAHIICVDCQCYKIGDATWLSSEHVFPKVFDSFGGLVAECFGSQIIQFFRHFQKLFGAWWNHDWLKWLFDGLQTGKLRCQESFWTVWWRSDGNVFHCIFIYVMACSCLHWYR